MIHGNSDYHADICKFPHNRTHSTRHRQWNSNRFRRRQSTTQSNYTQLSHVKRISCERHLQNNCVDFLREKTDTRKQIIHAIFGHNTGLMSGDREVIFQERADEVIGLVRDKTPTFENHYINNILPILTENIQTAWKYELVHWTNNNCESMNHTLKLNINWSPQSLPTLIDSIHNFVQSQYTNVERAVFGKGEYELDSKFRHFGVARAAWLKKTPDQQARHLIRMSKALALQNHRQCVTSSDGQRHTYSAPGGGKKPVQVKRKRACSTRTGKDIAGCTDSDSE